MYSWAAIANFTVWIQVSWHPGVSRFSFFISIWREHLQIGTPVNGENLFLINFQNNSKPNTTRDYEIHIISLLNLMLYFFFWV